MVVKVIHDCILQFCDAFERAAADALFSDLSEESLDHVQPGGRGRDEMEMEARMPLEPTRDRGGFMGGVVVDD